jgi:hypothetical protein
MRILLLLVVFVAPFWTASAQRLIDDDARSANAAAYYYYARTGDVTQLVYVWGGVAFPGLYEVPADTRLTAVLSLAGGPRFEERPRRSKRTVRVRVLRNQGGTQALIYRGVMQNEMVVPDPDPALRDGDTIVVESETRERFTFRDVFPVIAAIASVTIAIERLVN